MSIDVYASTEPEPWNQHERPVFDELGDDAYYAFLFPLFKELQEQTGQLIDPYGSARFEGEQLKLLLATIHKARQMVSVQPSEWQVLVGWTDPSRAVEILSSINKERFQARLMKFEKVVEDAIAMHNHLVFLGD